VRPLTPFYFSELIINSDLKPDNILLDAAGHAHITDFNVAIHYSERRMHTSVAGSMAYMAPQVVGRKGYSWAIDWWSLGVTAYELIFHKRPFDGRSAEKMTQAILKEPLKFPEDASTRCSDAGISALKGVRLTYFHLIGTCSSITSVH
jgi:serine/threonine kinase 32